jgi:hypothetical protein
MLQVQSECGEQGPPSFIPQQTLFCFPAECSFKPVKAGIALWTEQ